MGCWAVTVRGWCRIWMAGGALEEFGQANAGAKAPCPLGRQCPPPPWRRQPEPAPAGSEPVPVAAAGTPPTARWAMPAWRERLTYQDPAAAEKRRRHWGEKWLPPRSCDSFASNRGVRAAWYAHHFGGSGGFVRSNPSPLRIPTGFTFLVIAFFSPSAPPCGFFCGRRSVPPLHLAGAPHHSRATSSPSPFNGGIHAAASPLALILGRRERLEARAAGLGPARRAAAH